jgi:hypothetical protein
VQTAADDAAQSILDAWRRAGWRTRIRSVPTAASEGLEQLLDRIVKAAIEAPYPVHTAAAVVERMEHDGHPPPFGGALLLALAARTRKAVKVGRRTIPVAVMAKLGTDVVSSFRLGAYELELLASFVVHRLRAAGQPVEPRLVQRVTVNAYLNPGRKHDVTEARRSAAPALAAMWAGRVLVVEPAFGRMRKAAALVESLDVSGIAPVDASSRATDPPNVS